MEENKTLFDYIGQLFATYGIVIMIFMAFGMLIGEGAQEHSSLFSLGSEGFTMATLFQIFLLVVLITCAHHLFLTDRWIKGFGIILRYGCFFSVVFVAMILFSIAFAWFPINDMKAWLGFLISFVICTIISLVIRKFEECAENKKLEQALSKLKKDIL